MTWTICPVKVTSIFAIKKMNLTLLKGNQQKHKGQQAQIPTRVIPVRYEKNIFSMWAVQLWNGLPREAVESPSLEIFKVLLDKTLTAALSMGLNK